MRNNISMEKDNILSILWYFFDTLILFMIGFSLVNIHLILSILVLTVTLIFTSAKMVVFFTDLINKRKNEKNN